MPADDGPPQKVQRQSANSSATIGDIVDFTGVRMSNQGDNNDQLFEPQQSVSDCSSLYAHVYVVYAFLIVCAVKRQSVKWF